MKEIRNIAIDTPNLRQKQQQHKYTMGLNNNNNENENNTNGINDNINWRDIALKNEWFAELNSKKYSLGLGLGNGQRPVSSEFDVIKDEKEIILQETCDKVEIF